MRGEKFFEGREERGIEKEYFKIKKELGNFGIKEEYFGIKKEYFVF